MITCGLTAHRDQLWAQRSVSSMGSLYLFSSYHNHHNRFMAIFPGPAGARRKLLLDFMVLGRITRGRHTDNQGGRYSIQTNQQSTSINHPFLHWMHFLPQPSQFILAWDRHRNMLDCIHPWLGYTIYTEVNIYYAENDKRSECESNH